MKDPDKTRKMEREATRWLATQRQYLILGDHLHICSGDREKDEIGVVVPTGKVRTDLVKRISMELVEKYPRSFSMEFEQNKQFLKEIELDVSKKLRNRIAGYISGLIKIKQAFSP